MYFQLIKTLDGVVGYYGDIPEYTEEGYSEKTVYHRIETEEERDLLLEDFVDPINELCGTLLDYSDVDWFDPESCVKLKGWLEERLQSPCEDRLRVLYTVLLDFADRAIELDTGVVVEL